MTIPERYRVEWPHDTVPAWLAPHDTVHLIFPDGSHHTTLPVTFYQTYGDNWRKCIAFTIEADHWAVEPLRAGFTPWAGGSFAPSDWDAGPCRLNTRMSIIPTREPELWGRSGNDWIVGYNRRIQPDNIIQRKVSDTPPAASQPARWAVWRAEQEHAKANGWEPNALNVDTLLTDTWKHDARLTLARYIERTEKPPVDPAIIAVREIVAAWWKGAGLEEMSDYPKLLNGDYDELPRFAEALAAFRRHAATLAEQSDP